MTGAELVPGSRFCCFLLHLKTSLRVIPFRIRSSWFLWVCGFQEKPSLLWNVWTNSRVSSSFEEEQPFVMEAEGRWVGPDRAGVSDAPQKSKTGSVLGPNCLTESVLSPTALWRLRADGRPAGLHGGMQHRDVHQYRWALLLEGGASVQPVCDAVCNTPAGQTVELLERPSERPGWCLVRTTDRNPPQEGLVPSSALCVSHSRSSVEMDCFFSSGRGRTSSSEPDSGMSWKIFCFVSDWLRRLRPSPKQKHLKRHENGRETFIFTLLTSAGETEDLHRTLSYLRWQSMQKNINIYRI